MDIEATMARKISDDANKRLRDHIELLEWENEKIRRRWERDRKARLSAERTIERSRMRNKIARSRLRSEVISLRAKVNELTMGVEWLN